MDYEGHLASSSLQPPQTSGAVAMQVAKKLGLPEYQIRLRQTGDEKLTRPKRETRHFLCM